MLPRSSVIGTSSLPSCRGTAGMPFDASYTLLRFRNNPDMCHVYTVIVV